MAAEAEPLVPSPLSGFWSVADFQDLLRPRWESASVGSVTYRSACSLNWANSMKYYRIIDYVSN